MRPTCALLAILFAAAIAHAQSAVTTAGKTVRGTLQSATKDFALQAADGTRIPLAQLREVRFDAAARRIPSRGPLRTFTLPGGDVITGELQAWDGKAVRFRAQGASFALPRAAITEIAPLVGQRLLLSESPKGESREWPLPAALTEGLVQVWFQGGAAQAQLELLTARGSLRLAVPFPESKGESWRCLGVWLQPGATRVTLDGELISEAGALGSIAHIRLHAGDSARLADLLVLQSTTGRDPPAPVRVTSQDVVQLFSGDELFGNVQDLTDKGVELKTAVGLHRTGWSEIRRVVFAGKAPSGEPVEGLVARVELSAVLGSNGAVTDRLYGAITAIEKEHVQLSHPWLGTLRLPIREIVRIVPEFSGRVWVIDLSAHHLGDEVRTDFVQPRAEGPTLSFTWTAPESQPDTVRITLRVADLEPCGPNTPADSPFLKELQANGLVTELRVNGQRVAFLNRLIDVKSPPSAPALLQVAVSRRIVKAGANTIQFMQRSQRGEPSVFDDVQISDLRVVVPAK